MKGPFADKEHLVRMAGLFAAGVAVFLLLEVLLVPKGFGELGHYRAGALGDVAGLPVVHAGRAACAECHTDEAERQKKGKHAGVGCEACHGALAKHALVDPAENKAVKPDGAKVCVVCHLPNVAKPAKFPTVDPATHGEGARCVECHSPHLPSEGPDEGKKP
jgi:hypothetical protein